MLNSNTTNRNTSLGTIISTGRDTHEYKTSHHSQYLDITAGNYGHTTGISKDTEDILNSLWHDSLYHYRIEITKIIARARIELGSSTDINATKVAVSKTMDELMDNSSRYFEYHRNTVHDLIDKLPIDQAKAATDYWKAAHDRYKEYTRSFYAEVMKTMRSLIDLNIKILKQCSLLEKEIEGIYEETLPK